MLALHSETFQSEGKRPSIQYETQNTHTLTFLQCGVVLIFGKKVAPPTDSLSHRPQG